jgi:hypothetical protein
MFDNQKSLEAYILEVVVLPLALGTTTTSELLHKQAPIIEKALKLSLQVVVNGHGKMAKSCRTPCMHKIHSVFLIS